MVGVYKITNTINWKVYIGESMDIERRWEEHREHLRNGIHHSKLLQEDYNTYGIENFKFEILEEIDDNLKNMTQKCIIIVLESKYIKQYDSINKGYNIENTLELILKGERSLYGNYSNRMQIKLLKNIMNNLKENNGVFIPVKESKNKENKNKKPKIITENMFINDNLNIIINKCKNYKFENEYQSISKTFLDNGFNRKYIYQILRDLKILSKNDSGNICMINDLSMFKNQEDILKDDTGNIIKIYSVPYITRKGFKYLLKIILKHAKSNNINIFTDKFIKENLIVS